MADKSKEKKTKEEKKKENAEKKALKNQAKEAKKEAKKKAKLEKKSQKEPSQDSTEEKAAPKKKKPFFTIKKLIILTVLTIILLGAGFAVYKIYFSKSDDPNVYQAVTLKNVNLPDEMLKFAFDNINDLYFAFVTYDLRIFLIDKEIDRIQKIGDKYPEQIKITEIEKKDWIKAKDTVKKKFVKIEKQIKEIYVLFNVNQEKGEGKLNEVKNDLISQANEALEPLDQYIKKLKLDKPKEHEGLINKTMDKIKKIL